MVFFQSQICDSEPGSQRFGHIADVPWLVRDAGDLLFAFWVPEDKTIERSVLFSQRPSPVAENLSESSIWMEGQETSRASPLWCSLVPGSATKGLPVKAPSVAGRNDIRKLPTGSDRICDRHGKAGKRLLQPDTPEVASDLPVLLQMEVRYR